MSKAQKIARLKEIIRELIKKHLEEVSTTASAGIDGTGTGHYDTPNAFVSGSQGGHPNPEVVGYKKVNEDVINEYVSADNFNKDFNTAMDLVIKQANNLKGPLAKHPIKRNVNKLKAVQKLFNKFIKPALVKKDRSLGKGFDLTRIKQELADAKFKSVVQYLIMPQLGGSSYDSNSFYMLDDKDQKLLDRIWKELRKLTNIMDKAQLESVNESYASMMGELEKLYRPSGAPPIAKEALKDLAEEYDIGRVLYAARTNKKSFMEVMDLKIDQLQGQFVNKKHIQTIKRGKNLKEALNDSGVKEFKKELTLDVKYVKALSKLINKKSVGKVTEKDDQIISSLTNLLQGRFSGLANMLKNKNLNEGRYHDWRNDESMTPKQKVGRSMREIRDALNELDKTVKMNLKLKTELNMNSQDYWKNTHKALTKISERLVKMANKIGNLK
jgi:hypothetical protein